MDSMNEMECLTIARRWLSNFSFSAATWNLDDHMDLISRAVLVYGLPSAGIVDYSGFKKRRSNEFQKKLLLSITHKDLALLDTNGEHITFAVKETLKSMRGDSFVLDKEIRLCRENDGKWRAVEEQIKYITRK